MTTTDDRAAQRTLPRLMSPTAAHPPIDNQIRLVNDGTAWLGTFLAVARTMVNDILDDGLPIAITLVQETTTDKLLVTTGLCTRWADNAITFADGVTIQVDEGLRSVTI